ncbi:PEP-CTERM sorting domain-containing protein [Tautonia plasticadhaerens]|uniref:PEP-CTERM sorting domain-containing protein n=1 Tax=Tautonia plasticadhaerens TaxID=2527974 RepID=UPI0011A5C174
MRIGTHVRDAGQKPGGGFDSERFVKIPNVTAVPEPSTLAGGILGTLLASGLWLRRRRQST